MSFVSAAPPLFVRNARIAFGDRVVADDLTLEFAAGLTTCLLGRSGVGKTSLLRWLAGLMPGTQVMMGAKQSTANREMIRQHGAGAVGMQQQ